MSGYPELNLDVSEWLNWAEPDLDSLRGKVVLIETFQMLCPGCVAYGIPQALKVHRTFSRDQVVVLGLHTVFEHHAVMGPEALRVFLHEYRIDFPVGIDRPGRGDIPSTMGYYGLQGTPSTLLVDRAGQVRQRMFGEVPDLRLGALIGQLLCETAPPAAPVATEGLGAVCAPGVGCS